MQKKKYTKLETGLLNQHSHKINIHPTGQHWNILMDYSQFLSLLCKSTVFTWHGAHSYNQTLNQSIKGKRGAQNGHALRNILPHLLL